MKMRKGVVLITVSILVFLAMVVLSFYYFAVRSYVDRVDGALDKTMAYYLCESGLTLAIISYYNGGPKKGYFSIPVPATTMSYEGFSIYPKTYKVYYEAEKGESADKAGFVFPTTGFASFKIWVKSPRGFKHRTYYLTASSQRAIPIFIRGKP